ncbi:MAG TPA: L,D-transpeptidase family protein [Pseudolabrys sp.]|nr:L,D-transpeptidase family protein [Pseudolabrys sp.]
MRWNFVVLLFFIILAGAAVAEPLEIETINNAQLHLPLPAKERINPTLIKAQLLLDRAHFSPGEIDGKFGDNFKKALIAFAAAQGLNSRGELTDQMWQKLTATSSEPVLTKYTISNDDVRGPFVNSIPTKLEQMKDLPVLAYTSAREKIAEKFHMSQGLLSALNSKQKFETANETIVVANVVQNDASKRAARVEVDKSAQVLKVFGRDQQLLAVYPVTVGSTEKPAPSGRLKVTGISKNPTYRYNPKYAFKGVRATKPFTIKPGPNNPVGLVWIGLSGEGYGIHGTPDPSKVSKTASHGCIRLTNWDALRVASAVVKGTPVDFLGDEEIARRSRAEAPRRRKHR